MSRLIPILCLPLLLLSSCQQKLQNYQEAIHLITKHSPDQIIVRVDGKYGVISEKRKILIPLHYDYLFWNEEPTLYTAASGGEVYWINTQNERIDLPVEPLEYSEGLAPIQREKKWGYVNLEGKIVIPCTYTKTQAFSDGLALVQREGESVFIDADGKEIFGVKYLFKNNDIR
ncbi:MAG: WG repeat-containing protein [Bacteroidota bacterium]